MPRTGQVPVLFLTLASLCLAACGDGGEGPAEPDPPRATSLTLVSGPTAMPLNRVVFGEQPLIQILDQHGSGVSQEGVMVTASIGAGGGTLGGTNPVATMPNGQASFSDLSLSGTAGTRTLNFLAVGLVPASVEIMLLPGLPALVEKTEGDSQFVSAGQSVPIPPSVRISDADGNPVPGVNIRFAVEEGGGSLSGEMASTDVSGVAAVGTWTLGPEQWRHVLTATPEPDGVVGGPIRFAAYGFPPWSRVTVTGEQPAFSTGVTYNRQREKLTVVNTVYGIGELSPTGGTWSHIENEPKGAGRVYAAVHEATQRILIISDSDGPWFWDYGTETWTAADVGDVPGPRMFPAMVYDSIHARVLLYGGHVTGGSSDPVADLFSWDGTSWTRLSDPPSGPRGGHAMAYDPATGDIFVHGGTDLGNAFGGRATSDTWVLNRDGVWQELTTEHPQPLAIFAMAFDEVRQTLVALGGTLVGTTGYGLSTEIWELVEGQWHLSDKQTPVGARVVSTLVFAPTLGKLLLYGNEAAGWNDVWSYGF